MINGGPIATPGLTAIPRKFRMDVEFEPRRTLGFLGRGEFDPTRGRPEREAG